MILRVRPTPNVTVGIESTRLAKAAFWLAGPAGRVKTYQRYWTIEFDKAAEYGFRMVPGGRHWHSGLRSRLLRLSIHLDPAHWDHWALVHDRCSPDLCPTCGSCRCDLEGEDEP